MTNSKNRFGIKKTLTLCLAMLVLASLPASLASDTKNTREVQDVRYWASPDHIRIVADLSEEFSHTIKSEGRRLVFNLPQAKVGASTPRVQEINAEPVRAIMLKQKWDGSVEMEIILSRPSRFKSFALKALAGKPPRLVVDIETGLQTERETTKSETTKVLPTTPSPLPASPPPPVSAKARTSHPKIVVIDAGHGGEDSGAIGAKGTQEKVLTLDISRRVARELNREALYKAYLTRDGDYYVSFRNRIALARKKEADLFVSIHVDAAHNRRATGASVYALSLSGASNEAARILARQENLADMVGGVDEAERMEESDAIVLSMFQTSTINSSLLFGDTILKRLGGATSLKYKVPQVARFRVLMLPDVPSLLVEVGFISNPREEALLRTEAHRQKLALRIVAGIKDFLAKAK